MDDGLPRRVDRRPGDDQQALPVARDRQQRPLVVRALYEAASALERTERFERRKAQLPAKTGVPWTEEEDRKLLAAFDAGRALQELAAAHERTMGAVRARLLKYGRINA